MTRSGAPGRAPSSRSTSRKSPSGSSQRSRRKRRAGQGARHARVDGPQVGAGEPGGAPVAGRRSPGRSGRRAWRRSGSCPTSAARARAPRPAPRSARARGRRPRRRGGRAPAASASMVDMPPFTVGSRSRSAANPGSDSRGRVCSSGMRWSMRRAWDQVASRTTSVSGGGEGIPPPGEGKRTAAPLHRDAAEVERRVRDGVVHDLAARERERRPAAGVGGAHPLLPVAQHEDAGPVLDARRLRAQAAVGREEAPRAAPGEVRDAAPRDCSRLRRRRAGRGSRRCAPSPPGRRAGRASGRPRRRPAAPPTASSPGRRA